MGEPAASHVFKTAKHASLYSKFRPVPPQCLVDRIAKLVESRKQLLDVGCGSGQGTIPMAKHFDRIIGTDISEAQVQEAQKQIEGKPLNIQFRVAPATPLPFGKESFDAITGSQCVHWFDLDAFYKSCRWALRKRGILAMYGYCTPLPVTDDEDASRKAEALVTKFDKETINKYWDIDRTLIDNCYRDLKVPTEGFEEADRDEHITDEREITLKDYISYLRSWSPYQKYLKENENTSDVDPLDELQANLLKTLSVEEETKIKLRINFFLVAYRKTG